MYLSIACPTTPWTGKGGGKVGSSPVAGVVSRTLLLAGQGEGLVDGGGGRRHRGTYSNYITERKKKSHDADISHQKSALHQGKRLGVWLLFKLNTWTVLFFH
jgi:hypothetical protein